MKLTDEPVSPPTSEWHHTRIKLTETTLEPERVKTSFERLHHLDTPVEFLLVSDGERVDYYAGNKPAEIDGLERILRGCFPDDYESTRADPELETHFDAPDEVTTVEFTGRGERRQDWQTGLATVASEERDEPDSLLLVPAVGTMAETTAPVVYQALLDPMLDWRPGAEVRHDRLKRNEDTLSQQLFGFLTTDYDSIDEEREIDPSHQRRVEAIEAKDCRRSFTVHARAAAVGEDAHMALAELDPAFEAASGDFYHIDPRFQTGETALEVLNRIRERTIDEPSLTERLTERLPITSNRRREIVTDPTTVPNLTFLSGARLGTIGKRGLDATSDERTAVDRPPENQPHTQPAGAPVLPARDGLGRSTHRRAGRAGVVAPSGVSVPRGTTGDGVRRRYTQHRRPGPVDAARPDTTGVGRFER